MSQATQTIVERYTDAWNRHDVSAILALHTEDASFENHTSGGAAVGKAELRKLIDQVFASFADLRFTTRRAYFAENVAIVEWTATATHAQPIARGTRTFAPTGKTLAWNGVDVLPIRDGLIARKDVYADSVSFLKQLGSSLP
ncbi:MAG TPA: nuclear transport factor 2 family protein [Polyangiaceae bacterium]